MGNYWLDVLEREEKKEFHDLSAVMNSDIYHYPKGYVRSKYPTGIYMDYRKLAKNQNRDRKLRATWTKEANDDLMSWVDMSGRALTELMTKEIRQEIDRKILTDLRNASKE